MKTIVHRLILIAAVGIQGPPSLLMAAPHELWAPFQGPFRARPAFSRRPPLTVP